MRIGLNLLFIIPGQNGGTQTYAESLIKALAALNQENEFTVFVSEEGASLVLPNQPNFRKVICPIRAVRREMRYAYEQTAFSHLLARSQLDVLHSLGYVCPLYPPCPSVVSIPDLNYLTPWHGMSHSKKLFLGWFVGQSARKADAILTISEFSKSQILRFLHVPEAKVVVTLLGPREPSAETSDRWEDLQSLYKISASYMMAFGSLTANKNISRLVQAFAGIHHQVSQTLLLVGHLPPGSALTAEMAALNLGDRIQSTGYVDASHIMPLLAHADLFVFPSLYEGFGLPVLEAQSAGTPVACSTAASLPEVAGKGAVFFDPASTEEMGQVLLQCLQDQALRDHLAELGHENARLFSWEQTARQTLEVYQQVGKSL